MRRLLARRIIGPYKSMLKIAVPSAGSISSKPLIRSIVAVDDDYINVGTPNMCGVTFKSDVALSLFSYSWSVDTAPHRRKGC